MPKFDGYLRITEAAKYLGVSPNTLRNWGRSSQIYEHRHPINNYRLYKQADLDKLLGQVERTARPRRKPR